MHHHGQATAASRRPSWPAAFSEVVSVGALAAEAHRALVQQFGVGRRLRARPDVVNAYATGMYIYQVRPYGGPDAEF